MIMLGSIWNTIGRKYSCWWWMWRLICICKVCFKSWFEWKRIVNIHQAYPSVHRTVLSLRSIDTYVLQRSVILESYIAEVLKLKNRYRTEVTEEPFILMAQLTEILTCFLSKLDTVDVTDLSTWAGCIFPHHGDRPFEGFQPSQCGMSAQVSQVLQVSQDLSGSVSSSHFESSDGLNFFIDEN